MQKENDRLRNEVTRDKAAMVIEFDIAAPRPTVWEYSPCRASGQNGEVRMRCAKRWKATAEGVGTTNHCMHGAHVIVEEVIDWRPFDHLTLTTLLPMPGAPKVLMTYAFLENADGSTHIEIRVAKPKPKDKAFLERVGAEFQKNIAFGGSIPHQATPACWLLRAGPLAAGVL